jgi:hypothetical protein
MRLLPFQTFPTLCPAETKVNLGAKGRSFDRGKPSTKLSPQSRVPCSYTLTLDGPECE